MPGTVDDFMNRFGGGGTIDDNEAQQYHDRFVSTDSKDRDFDNQTYHKSATEYLGKLPDDQFQDAARTAYNQAAPQERQGLLGGLLAAVTSGAAGGGISDCGAAAIRRSARPEAASSISQTKSAWVPPIPAE